MGTLWTGHAFKHFCSQSMKFREVAQGGECTVSNTLFLLIPIPSRDPVDVSCGRVGLSRLETRGTSGAAVVGIC